jgi:uncharacterized protein (TIGR03382 family)
MTNSYGIGASAEGSAIASESVDEYGVTFSGTVQTKGYFNSSYRVDTQYQVTLYRWELEVDGSPGSMNWDMVLNSNQTFGGSDRDDNNAYHEYFLVMQADFDEPFTIDALTISAGYDKDWSLNESFAEVTLENITLNPPFWSPPAGDDDDDDDVVTDDDDDQVTDDDDDDDQVTDDDDDVDAVGDDKEDEVSLVDGGCSNAGRTNGAPGFLALLLLGLGLAPRRRS